MNRSRLFLVLSCLFGVAGSTAPAQDRGEGDTPRKTTRSYDVRAVVQVPPDSAFLVSPQGPLVFHPRQWESWESSPDLPRFGNERVKPKPDGNGLAADEELGVIAAELRAEGLVELLRRRVFEGDWEEFEFEGVSYRQGRLFVHGTLDVQERAERLVAESVARARRLLRIECLLVPPEILDELAPSWRQTAPEVDETVFSRALVDPRSRLLTAVARNGQKVTAGNKEIPALLAELDIDQTGVIPVTHPIVTVPLAGDRLDIRPFFIPGQNAVLLDLAIGRFRVESKESEVGELWGELDLATSMEALISVTTVMAPGKTYVAAGLDGANGSVALVRIHPQGRALPEASAPDSERYVVRTYDVDVLLRTNELRRWWTAETPAAMEITSLDADALIQLLMDTTGGEEVWDTEKSWIEYFWGQLHVSAPREVHAALGQLLDDEIRRRTEVVAVDLELLEMPREAFARVRAQSADGFRLGGGWRKALSEVEGVRQSTYSLMGLTAESHALRLAKLHSLVTGVDNVSGGTGFSVIEVSDPLEDVCGEGREFRLQVELGEGNEARLRLEGIDAALLEVRGVRVRYPAISGVVVSATGERGQAQGVGSQVIKEIELQLPRQEIQYWSLDRDVPLDQEVILDSDAGEGKDARLLVARVRRVR